MKFLALKVRNGFQCELWANNGQNEKKFGSVTQKPRQGLRVVSCGVHLSLLRQEPNFIHRVSHAQHSLLYRKSGFDTFFESGG